LLVDIPSEAEIRYSAERVCDLIIDFDGQARWLEPSSAFHGTEEVSSNPITLGATYREPGPLGVRNGTVTEFERPSKLTFHQPMTIRLHLGTVDVTMGYTLTPRSGSTHVKRVVTIDVHWPLKLLQPAVVHAFRVESARTLLALKTYADELA
jgi:hypothetical protein